MQLNVQWDMDALSFIHDSYMQSTVKVGVVCRYISHTHIEARVMSESHVLHEYACILLLTDVLPCILKRMSE